MPLLAEKSEIAVRMSHYWPVSAHNNYTVSAYGRYRCESVLFHYCGSSWKKPVWRQYARPCLCVSCVFFPIFWQILQRGRSWSTVAATMRSEWESIFVIMVAISISVGLFMAEGGKSLSETRDLQATYSCKSLSWDMLAVVIFVWGFSSCLWFVSCCAHCVECVIFV